MDIQSIYTELDQAAQKAVEYITQELRMIRTGKASPSMVEDLKIEAYGGSIMKLKEVATVGTDGPTTVVITPFDHSIIQDIEKGIQASPLNLNPNVDGHIIRISVPPLTEEQRQKYVKVASEKIEEGKEQIRRSRDDARKQVKALLESKSITEDDKYRVEEEIDKKTRGYNTTFDELKKRKSDEIMSIS